MPLERSHSLAPLRIPPFAVRASQAAAALGIGDVVETQERVARAEPVLARRQHQPEPLGIVGGDRLTSQQGAQQGFLALGRALMLAPRILLIDEPSVGLAPVLVSRTIDKIKELKERYQLTVLMAEQNFPQALRIADRGYVIVHGKIAFEGRSADELNNNDLIRKFYLGL